MSNDRLTALLDEYAELEKRLADPAIHADQAHGPPGRPPLRRAGPAAHGRTPSWRPARADLAAARELAAEDPSFAGEVEAIAAALPPLEEKLAEMLIPRDPHDAKDVIVEIKAGEGGEESALFAGDLLRMYTRYAERHGWVIEVIDAQDSDLGGVKDVSVAVKTKGVPEGGHGVWSRLKWEGGVHRVQRVPVTESQGRIHTSRRRRAGAARGRGRRRARSTRATSGSTCSARPAPAASRSTPPTPRSGSPTCPPASW